MSERNGKDIKVEGIKLLGDGFVYKISLESMRFTLFVLFCMFLHVYKQRPSNELCSATSQICLCLEKQKLAKTFDIIQSLAIRYVLIFIIHILDQNLPLHQRILLYKQKLGIFRCVREAYCYP